MPKVTVSAARSGCPPSIVRTTLALLIRNMGVDSISGNTKLARGQGNVSVTVAQSLTDFDASYFFDGLPDAARTG